MKATAVAAVATVAATTASTTWRGAALPLAVVLALGLSACERKPAADHGAAAGPASSASSSSASASAARHEPVALVPLQYGVIRGLTTSNLAKEDGFLERALARVNATLVWRGPFSNTPNDALSAGQVDVSFTTATGAASALLGNVDYRIFAYQEPDWDGEGIWVRPAAGIHSLRELKGHTIATDKGSSGHHVLLKALEKAGLTPQDVKISYFDPADALAAFNSGQVDALSTWRTFGASAEKQGGGVRIASGRDIGSDNALLYVVRAQFAQEHPQIVKAVFEALHDAAAESAAHPDATAALWAKLGKLPPDVAERFVPPASRPVLPATPDILPILQRAAEPFVREKVIPRAPDFAPTLLDVNTIGAG